MNDLLIAAVKSGNLPSVKNYLSMGAQIDYCDETGQSALLWAAQLGQVEMVEYLIHQGARLDVMNSRNETAFLIAVRNRNFQLIKLFMQSERLPILEFEEALFYVIHWNDLGTLQNLYSFSIEHNARTLDGKTPFLYAVEKGFWEIVQYLYHVNPEQSLHERDNHGNYAIHCAVLAASKNLDSIPHAKILNFLIETAPNTVFLQQNNEHLDVYALAIKEKNLTLAKLLLSKGCYVDITVLERFKDKEQRRLYKASLYLFKFLEDEALEPCIKCIQLLVPGMNGRSALKQGNTALHVAISKNTLKITVSLLAKGASLDIKNNMNLSPYEMAVTHSNVLIQIAAHLYKTLRLLKEAQKPSPLETKEKAEGDVLAVNTDFEKELEMTLNKFKSLVFLSGAVIQANLSTISYFYYRLGKCLLNIKPDVAFELLQKVHNIPGEKYFAKAQAQIYTLIKLNKVQLHPLPDMEPALNRLFWLVRALLYSKKEVDDEGVSLKHYIVEYTQEKPEDIHALKTLTQIVTQDNVDTKDDFLLLLKLLAEKNHQKRQLEAELQRLSDLKLRHEKLMMHIQSSLGEPVKETPSDSTPPTVSPARSLHSPYPLPSSPQLNIAVDATVHSPVHSPGSSPKSAQAPIIFCHQTRTQGRAPTSPRSPITPDQTRAQSASQPILQLDSPPARTLTQSAGEVHRKPSHQIILPIVGPDGSNPIPRSPHPLKVASPAGSPTLPFPRSPVPHNSPSLRSSIRRHSFTWASETPLAPPGDRRPSKEARETHRPSHASQHLPEAVPDAVPQVAPSIQAEPDAAPHPAHRGITGLQHPL